ncbi:MAG: gfo/Idh/MocA family oxidoreductase, partial [Rubrimonas sp.]
MTIEASKSAGPARIRLGMVGGGRGAFIGAVHRIAARLDDRFQLAAGCFSSDPEVSRASGAELGLEPGRVYGDFEAMAAREARLKDGIEAVAIVTPNHMHLAPARA